MLRRILPFLLIAFTAHAGTVQTNVQVCGVTSTFERFGEQALAVTGSSDNGIANEVFRVKGYLNIEESPSSASPGKNSAIADFFSLSSINGVGVCVRGNLETIIDRNGNATYSIAPRWYKLDEPAPGILLPSQLPGDYQVDVNGGPSLTLAAVPDSDVGLRFEFSGFATFLTRVLGGACAGLDRASADPSLLAFSVKRLDRLSLTAQVSLVCDQTSLASDAVPNTLSLQVNLHRLNPNASPPGPISGFLRVEHPATNTHFQAQIHN